MTKETKEERAAQLLAVLVGRLIGIALIILLIRPAFLYAAAICLGGTPGGWAFLGCTMISCVMPIEFHADEIKD